MALTLAQAAVVAQDPIEAGVMNTMVIASPVLDRLPFQPIAGDSISYKNYGTLPGVEFRAVNSAYSESTGTFTDGSEGVVILGGDADVDNFIIATQGTGGVDQLGEQATMKTLAITYKFQDAFINGDTAVDANSFDGLKKRTVGAQVIDAATNGLSIVGTTDEERQAFFDLLDRLIAAVPGATPQNSALYTNAKIAGRITSAKRRLLMSTTTVDSFGKVVPDYRGYPVLDIGQRADGTEIIPMTETMGSSSVTGSIYLVKFGASTAERAVTGLQAGGPLRAYKLGELQSKPAQRLRIDWYPGLGVFNGKAVARIRGLKDA